MRKTLLFVLSFLCVIGQIKATHIVGSKMTYECLGNGDYKITVTNYVDCTGSAAATYVPVGLANAPNQPFTSINFQMSCPGGVINPVGSWVAESFTDISRLCPGVVSPCNANIPNPPYYGYAELTMTRTYNVAVAPCSTAVLSATTCCRNALITSISQPSGNGLYQQIDIPVSPTGCNNNSPQFLSEPRIFVCNNDTTVLNLSAFDPDGDSLFYKFYVPGSNSTTLLNYLPGYSSNVVLGPNWYVNLNSQSGELKVAGNGAAPEIGVIGLEVEEYRNGQLLGSVQMDFQIVGNSCPPDDAPSAGPLNLINGGIKTGPYELQAYVGVPLEFEITFTDDSALQMILDAGLGSQIPGAVITGTGSNPFTLNIKWTPDSTFEGLTFFAGPTVIDDNCPIANSTYRPIQFNVVPLTYDAIVTNSDCNVNNGAIDITIQGTQGAFDFLWSTGDTTSAITGLGPGTYTVVITNSSGFSYSESFVVNAGTLQSNLTISTPTCGQNDGSLSVAPSGGIPPYSITWNTGATSNSINNLPVGGYSVVITDSQNCYQLESVYLDFDDSCGTFVNGRVYFDADTNCVYGVGDTATAGILVYSSQGYGTFTNSQGYYRLRVDPGVFALGASVMSNSFSCAQQTKFLNLSLGDDTMDVDFPWFVPPTQDLVALGGHAVATPGRITTVYASVFNQGNIPMSGYVELEYDPGLRYYGSMPNVNFIDSINRIIRWDFAGLLPYQTNFHYANFIVDSTLLLGDQLTNYVRVFPDSGDVTPNNNVDTVITFLRASFDPNDKQVSPVGLGELGLIKMDEKDHSYRIRFQNIGNYPAQNVLIRDTIDENLELTSLRPLFASDDYVVNIKPGRIVEFLFEDIFLPDSLSDPEGSIGEIQFTIQSKPDLPKGTQIRNKAGIYFDFNDPIITNEALNTFYIQPKVEIPTDLSGINCEGDEITALLATEGMEPYTYTWSTGDIDSRIFDLQSTSQLDSSGWYYITVVDSFGITTVDSVEVGVTPKPSIDLSWTIGNNEVSFSAGDPSLNNYNWVFGNGTTSNEAEPQVDVSGLPGLTVLLIASNDCGSDTSSAVVLLTGLEPKSEFGEVKIMPHPVQDISTLQFDNPSRDEVSLIVLDTRGREVFKFEPTNGENFVIEKGDLPEGIYLYKLRSQNGRTHHGKLIMK